MILLLQAFVYFTQTHIDKQKWKHAMRIRSPRRKSLSMLGLAITASIVVILTALLVFIWQYNTILPHSYSNEHTEWWHGLLNGLYAAPNFVVNLFNSDKTATIFQNGADVWYSLWFLLGIGGFSAGVTTSTRN